MVSSSRNVLWHPDSGMFGFVTGQAIIIEDLKGNSDSSNGEASNASSSEEMLGSEQKILSGAKEEISLSAVSHDGRYVAGAEYCRGETGYIYVWSSHGNLLHSFRHEQGNIQVLQFDPSSKCLISIGRYVTDKVVVWDIASGTELCAYRLAPGAPPIQAAKMLLSGPSVSLNGASFKFLTIGQRSIKEWTFYESPEYGLTVFNAIDLPSSTNAYPEYLTAIDCRPSAHHERDNLVAVGGSAGTVWLFRTTVNTLDEESSSLKFKLEGKFPVLNGGIEHIQWRANVSAIVVGGVSNKVKLIGLGVDATSSPKTLLTTILDGSVKSMTWEPNLKDGIIGTDAGSIWYLSHSHGKSISSTLVRSHTSNVVQIKSGNTNGDNLLASAGGQDGTIRVWHIELMQHLLTLDAPPSSGDCNTLCFSSVTGDASNMIAGGFDDGAIWKYDISSVIAGGGKGHKILQSDVTPAVKIAAHQSAVTRVVFMKVDNVLLLVSGSAAGNLSVHDGRFMKDRRDGSSTARPSTKLNSPHAGNKILSIETSPFDPTMFLVSSENYCISVWKISVEGEGNDASVQADQVACSIVDVRSEEDFEDDDDNAIMAPPVATFSPVDSDLIVMLGGKNPSKLFFWQFENSLIMRSIDLDNLVFPTSLCINTNAETGSHFIAVGCRAGNLIFMDYHSGEITKCGDSIHGDSVRGICFLENANKLVTASQNNLHMWKFLKD